MPCPFNDDKHDLRLSSSPNITCMPSTSISVLDVVELIPQILGDVLLSHHPGVENLLTATWQSDLVCAFSNGVQLLSFWGLCWDHKVVVAVRAETVGLVEVCEVFSKRLSALLASKGHLRRLSKRVVFSFLVACVSMRKYLTASIDWVLVLSFATKISKSRHPGRMIRQLSPDS